MNGHGKIEGLWSQLRTMKNPAYQITDAERSFAIDHLARSRDHFINTIKDLPENVWYTRPGAGEWTPAECAEHIQQTEVYYFEPILNQMLADAPKPEQMAELAGKEEIAIKAMEERAFKVKGQPWEEIPNKKVDKEALILSFTAVRNKIIEFLKTADNEFRVHIGPVPGMGNLDAYQFILYISAHTNRHTGQIQDVVNLVSE